MQMMGRIWFMGLGIVLAGVLAEVSVFAADKPAKPPIDDGSKIVITLTLPRFYRHLHKGENSEIGGDHGSQRATSIYRGV